MRARTPFSTTLWWILFAHDGQIMQNDVFR
jgi:hypothetical protein